MKARYTMFARYNQWANRRLYEAVTALPESDYRADRGAFFGSLHGTLNHVVVTDRIWMERFTGEGPVHMSLDEVPYGTLAELAAARRAEDERIIAFVDGLAEDDLSKTFSYRRFSDPREITQPLTPALDHFFNHQTHHRGQAHSLVTMSAGNDAMPALDLLYFQRETGIGLT